MNIEETEETEETETEETETEETETEETEKLPANYYFNNTVVEKLIIEYQKTGCTNITLRDAIMSHTSELIINVIRTHNLHTIYGGKDESSFNDLFQIAWQQIESTLYKFNSSPGHSKIFNMWCCAPETLLLTNKGIEQLGDISLGLQSKVYGLNGLQQINAGLIRPKDNTLQIKTKLGYEIEGSPEHSILCCQNDTIDFINLQQLKIGDLVGIQYSQQNFIDKDDISDIILTQSGEWSPPQTIYPELAYILGLYIAEGYRKYGQFGIYNTDTDIINFLINNTLKLHFEYHPKRQLTHCCNKRFIEFISKLGFDIRQAHKKIIPHRILQMSKPNIIAFICGMFDGDGHSSRYNGCVSYTSTSTNLINQLRMVLLNLGILTRIYKDKRTKPNKRQCANSLKDAWQLILPTEYSKKYYETIGFNIKRKQNKQTKLRPSKSQIYGLGKIIKKLYQKSNNPKCRSALQTIINTHRADTYQINTIIDKLPLLHQLSQEPEHVFIQDRIQERTREYDNIIWLPITHINKSQNRLCEISVQSPDHSYVANGIISHNSQVARTCILATIKKDNRDRKNSENYKYHLDDKVINRDIKFERFIQEAKEIFQYCDEHVLIIDKISELYYNDDRPHEGLISKLSDLTQLSRIRIVRFVKILRILCGELSDGPIYEVDLNIVKPSTIICKNDDD